MYRIGHGFDIHCFDRTQQGTHQVMLCGVALPCTYPIEAHSDGDVALHALMDALLGAVGAGDIGEHFPNTDPTLRGISSVTLLVRVLELLEKRGYRIVNVDLTILAETPKISPAKTAMQQKLADVLKIALDCINIKATTTEKLGAIGRSEGIAVHCVALLQKV